MTWIQYASIAVLTVSAITGLLLVLTVRRKPATRVTLLDTANGRVVVHVEHGDYRVSTNVATHAEASSFIKTQLAALDGDAPKETT